MNQSQAIFKGLDRSIRMQKIVETATGLFHRKGFKAATLDEVAKELGLTKAALYHYIPSKDKLLAIIYSQAFEKIFHRIYEISAMDISPAEKLRQVIRDHICNIITNNVAMFSVFFGEETQLPRKDFQNIRQEKKKYTRLVMDIVEEGMAQGVFRAGDPRLTTYAILGMVNWIFKWYKPGREVYSPEQIAEHFVALLEDGYLARPQREPQREAGPGRGSESKKQIYTELNLLSDQLASLIARLEQE